MDSFWTAEREAKLKALLAAGLSASAMAKELGTTRNAVISKRHRILGTRFKYHERRSASDAAERARVVERETEILNALTLAAAIGTPAARDAGIIVAVAAGVHRQKVAATVGLTIRRVSRIVNRACKT